MATTRIPFFPLGVVLFPGRNLPLHIFEERYKLMIGRCTQHHSPFGIILAIDDGIATIGCTANILQIAKTYDDGRMDIVTRGESPYRLHEIHNDEPYLEGDVEILDDDPSPAPAATAKELLALYQQCYWLLHTAAAPPLGDESDIFLAYKVAAGLPLDLKIRQAVLEIRVEADRRALLINRLNEAMPELERVQAAKSKVSGNGHPLN